ncbi:MAG: hypothetical protein Greene041662_673, partial [Candidatus Peregrinibacteria bacterium Greene0416_62]
TTAGKFSRKMDVAIRERGRGWKFSSYLTIMDTPPQEEGNVCCFVCMPQGKIQLVYLWNRAPLPPARPPKPWRRWVEEGAGGMEEPGDVAHKAFSADT